MPPHYLIIKVLLLTVALRIVSATHSPVSETRRNFPESDEVTVGRFVGFQVFVLSDSSVMVGTPLSSTVILNFLVLSAVEDLSNKPVMYKLPVDARRVNCPVPAVIAVLPSS